MPVIGIVGHEAAKFTAEKEAKARKLIRDIINDVFLDTTAPLTVISGRCPLGGIDIWAIEEARELGARTNEYPPAINKWEGGYKQRNIKIAESSNIVHCIVVDEYPPDYKGMRFNKCYHCNSTDHIKSGGCWTMKYAQKLGKYGKLWII